MDQPTYADIVKAFVDLMDGYDAAHVQHTTGLPWNRCVEIYQLYRACSALTDKQLKGQQ